MVDNFSMNWTRVIVGESVSKVCFVGGINALSTYTRSRVLSAVGLV